MWLGYLLHNCIHLSFHQRLLTVSASFLPSFLTKLSYALLVLPTLCTCESESKQATRRTASRSVTEQQSLHVDVCRVVDEGNGALQDLVSL